MSLLTEEWTGPALRCERDKAGIKLQDLAMDLEIDESHLSRVENGIRPLPADLPERYIAAVRRIARERAEAVGALEIAL